MTGTPPPAESPPEAAAAARSSRAPWLLAAAVVLVALAAAVRYRMPGDESEPTLRGNYEEAPAALQEVLDRAPPGERTPLLVRYATDPSPGLRYAAVDALGRQAGSAAAAALEAAFADNASLVRQRAVEVLPEVDRERGLLLLLTALRDEDTWIREAAATQLAMRAGRGRTVVDRRAVPALIRALDDPDIVVPTMAMSALRKLTGKPWRSRRADPPARRRATLNRWRAWWAGEAPKWRVSARYSNRSPVRPQRVDAAPDVAFRDVRGQVVDARDRGGALLLLNFWGTWCGPCVAETADLARLSREYGGLGVEIVGVAVAESRRPVELIAWCEQRGLNYRQALATKRLLKAFGDIHDVPVSVLIDGRGGVRYRWEGERDYAVFRAALDRLLAEPAA